MQLKHTRSSHGEASEETRKGWKIYNFYLFFILFFKAGHVEITVAPEEAKEETKGEKKEEGEVKKEKELAKKDPFIEGRIKRKLWKGVKFFWKQVWVDKENKNKHVSHMKLLRVTKCI